MIGAADESVLNLLRDVDVDGRGAALGAHLHLLAIFLLGCDEDRAFGRIVAAGLFDIDVLAGLQAGDGHGCVPVVGRGDGDGVDILGGEKCAEVLIGCGSVAKVDFVPVGELLRMTLSTSQTWEMRAFLLFALREAR